MKKREAYRRLAFMQSNSDGSTKSYLNLLNLQNKRIEALVEIPVKNPHSILELSHNGAVIVIGRRNNQARIVDLSSQSIGQKIPIEEDFNFTGHAALFKSKLYIPVVNRINGKGYVSVRDKASLKEIDRLFSKDGTPHEVMVIDNGKSLAVTNNGWLVGSNYDKPRFEGKTSLSVLCTFTGEELQTIRLSDEYRHLTFEHMVCTSPGVFVVGFDNQKESESKPLLAKISKGKVVFFGAVDFNWDSFNGDTLSLASNESGTVVSVTSRQGVYSTWDINSMQLIYSSKLKGTKGTSYLGREKVFYTLHKDGLLIVNDQRGKFLVEQGIFNYQSLHGLIVGHSKLVI